MSDFKTVQKELRKYAKRKTAAQSRKFFKTGKGQYAENSLFIGVRVPDIRKVAKEHVGISMAEMKKLIKSQIHEERLLGLIILVNKYKNAKSEKEEEKVYKQYVSLFKYVDNWDLVDASCPYIVGPYLLARDRSDLYKWAKSDHLWTKRIAMVSNWWLIRKNDLKDVFKIAQILLSDEHDLIHKAVGWMLREAGKKDLKKLEAFLKKNYSKIPRTSLRYAIERFPEVKRKRYLEGKI